MRNFILGTDWWTDCDDAVALRMLARSHKEGRICLKGIAINGCMEYSVASLEGFLNLEEIRGIPIGIDREATDFGGNPPYQKRLSWYAEKYKGNSDAEDAVRLYRRLLSNAEEKLEIIEIGYLQVITGVLESQPDDIFDQTGLQLVQEKVSKIWVMAGKWDEPQGRENNFCRNERSRIAAEKFCRLCPVPITFLGFEIGVDVITGECLEQDDYLYKALCDHGSPNGRSSWDPMLVQLALIGDETKAGYDVIKGTASVNVLTGANSFKRSDLGRHGYVIRKYEPEFYKEQIEKQIKKRG